jgi:uncharacterized metal-binding protein YceD (DUF177 family)
MHNPSILKQEITITEIDQQMGKKEAHAMRNQNVSKQATSCACIADVQVSDTLVCQAARVAPVFSLPVSFEYCSTCTRTAYSAFVVM